MPKFRYTAVGAGGKVVKGVMDVPDRAALVERLHAERQLPLEAALDADEDDDEDDDDDELDAGNLPGGDALADEVEHRIAQVKIDQPTPAAGVAAIGKNNLALVGQRGVQVQTIR